MTEGDLTEQLKSVASQVLTGDQLSAFLAIADAKRLADPDGNIDAERVSADLRTLYGITDQPHQAPQWGPSSNALGPPWQPGDHARAALAKRHGVKNANPASGPDTGIRPGDGGRAALQRRHGGKRS